MVSRDSSRVAAMLLLVRKACLSFVGAYDPEMEYEVARRAKYDRLDEFAMPKNIVESSAVMYSDINEHLTTLYLLTVVLKSRSVLELGTRTGESTLSLLEGSRIAGGHVTSVDIDSCEIAKNRIRAAGLEEYWSFIQGDDLQIDWSDPIDHLFIDTSHTYEHTLKELARFEPYVVSGGFLTLHDSTSSPGIRRAIDDFVRNRSDLRVFRYFHNNGLDVISKS